MSPVAKPLEYIDGIQAQRCNVCRIVKPFEEFYEDVTKRFGHGTGCKVCDKERARLWRINNPEKDKQAKRAWNVAHKENRRLQGWKGYGIDITNEQYIERLKLQNYRCAICSRPSSFFKRAFAPDHDHLTGEIRGLLCLFCNLGLGQFDDSYDRLDSAADYLRRYYEQRNSGH